MSHSRLVFLEMQDKTPNADPPCKEIKALKELFTTPCFLDKALFIGGVVVLVWGLPLDSHQLPRPEAFRPVLQLWVRCYREMRCSEVVRCLSFLGWDLYRPTKIRLESWKYHGNLRLKIPMSIQKGKKAEGGVFRWIALDFYGPWMTQQQMKMNVQSSTLCWI